MKTKIFLNMLFAMLIMFGLSTATYAHRGPYGPRRTVVVTRYAPVVRPVVRVAIPPVRCYVPMRPVVYGRGAGVCTRRGYYAYTRPGYRNYRHTCR